MSAIDLQPSPFGVLTEPAALTIRRRLPGPINRVWAYLTDSELRQQWLASGAMPQQPGATFELVWRNDELSASAAERPSGFSEVSRATCQITGIEPLRRLSFLWPGAGEVTFELDADGNDVMLTVTHRRLPDRAMTVIVGAGWHMHLDILVARVNGTPPASFWSGWQRLRAEYEGRIAA